MSNSIPMPVYWPHDENGKPMAIVVGAVAELVPTVQYGNITVGPTMIMRPIPNGPRQQQIDDARRVQRDAEFVCGVERRSSQWAMAGKDAKIMSPVPPGEEFGAPPADYDPNLIEPHPADAANGQAAAKS